jgi:Tfp pilus assembly protein PilO
MKLMGTRDRWLFVLLIAAAIVLIYVVFLIMPLQARAGRLTQEVDTLTTKIQEVASMYAEMPSMIEEVRGARARAAEQLFSEPDVPMAVMRQLDALASDLGLVVASITPQEPELVDGIMRYPTLFKVETDFAHLVQLLYEIEQPKQRLWVEAVRISTERGGAKLQAEIRTSAFAPAPESEEIDAEG